MIVCPGWLGTPSGALEALVQGLLGWKYSIIEKQLCACVPFSSSNIFACPGAEIPGSVWSPLKKALCYAGSDAAAQRQDSMSEDYAIDEQIFCLQYFFLLIVGEGDEMHGWHARKAGSGPWHVGAKSCGATCA